MASDARQAVALERIADLLTELRDHFVGPPNLPMPVVEEPMPPAPVGVMEPERPADLPAVSKDTEGALIEGGLTEAEAGELTGEVKKGGKKR